MPEYPSDPAPRRALVADGIESHFARGDMDDFQPEGIRVIRHLGGNRYAMLRGEDWVPCPPPVHPRPAPPPRICVNDHVVADPYVRSDGTQECRECRRASRRRST